MRAQASRGGFVARYRWALAMLGVLLLASGAAQACNSINPPRFAGMGSWEDALRVYVEADSASTGPHLSLADSSGAATSFSDPSMGATSGVNSMAGAIQNTAPGVIEFKMRAPLDKTYYLNLSKPIVGKLYWSSTTQAVHQRADTQYVRLEFFLDGKRIGGQEYVRKSSVGTAGFFEYNFCFRSETRALEQGKILSFKVTRFSSLADFQIGTGGNQQSFVEFRYFLQDPIAGALYVEKGKLIKSPASSPGSGGESVPVGAWAFLGALPGLAWAVSNRRARGASGVVLVLAVLLGVAVAGCVGSGSDAKLDSLDLGGSEDAKPTAEVRYSSLPEPSTPPNETAPPTGQMQGIVKDPNGFPLAGASVLVLATSLFTETGKDGRFVFRDVIPNSYKIRADKEGFESYEGTVEVLEGQVAEVTILLPYLKGKGPNDKPHIHDDWLGATEKTILAAPFNPVWFYAPEADLAAAVDVGISSSTTVYVPAATQRTEYCPAYGRCWAEVPIPEGVVVHPGTGRLEVTLKWTAGQSVFRELGLRIVTPSNLSFLQTFVPRPSNDPINIAIFPTEADPAHLKFTDWRFEVLLPQATGDHPFGAPIKLGAQVHITVKIFKSVVPFEPAHRDFWDGATELPLFTDATVTGRCVNCDYPYSMWGEVWRVGDKNGLFVPPETGEVRGTLRWSGTASTAGLTKWTLAYRGSNLPLETAKIPTYPRVTIAKEGTDFIDFVIKDANAWDQYYQQRSRWIFFVDDRDTPQKGLSTGYGTTWTLNAKAYRSATA